MPLKAARFIYCAPFAVNFTLKNFFSALVAVLKARYSYWNNQSDYYEDMRYAKLREKSY